MLRLLDWLGDVEGSVINCVACGCQIGWETLRDQFTQLLEDSNSGKEHDEIFDDLKEAVKNEGMNKHKWEEKAEDSLVSILLCLKASTVFIAEIAVITLSNFTHDYKYLQLCSVH